MIPVTFIGTSRDDILGFPASVRKEAGYQIERAQRQLEPTDWKPMPSVGPGVREIRVRDSTGAFRVIYVLRKNDGIYV